MGQSSGGGRTSAPDLGANPKKYSAAGAKYGFSVASPKTIKYAQATSNGGSKNDPSSTTKVRP
jgi:hypothetical protein